MPTLKQLIEEKTNRLESVPNKLISSVEKSQKKIFDELIVLVDGLETQAGKILLSDSNLVQVEIIVNKLKGAVYGAEYLEAVGRFAGEFNTQAQINNEYFTKILNEDFSTKAIYDNILVASQKNAIELLSDAGVNQAFFNPMKQILNTSVTTGQSMGEAIKALRLFVEGNPEIDGTLLRHVKQVARDGFSFSDRQYTNIVATDIGIEFYKYVGGHVSETRDFCHTRNGNYYHKKEIEKWEKLEWQGKAKGTTSSTIWVFAGGYNCLHSILPVSINSVPKEVIQRNIENGNYKEAA